MQIVIVHRHMYQGHENDCVMLLNNLRNSEFYAAKMIKKVFFYSGLQRSVQWH